MSWDNIIYLGIFGVGFLMLGLMAAFGDGEFDADGDVDVDFEATSPGVFSLKVISCFLVGFGAMATVSSFWISDTMELKQKLAADIGLGLAGGLLIGAAGWGIFKFFLSQQAHYSIMQEDFIGKRANLRVGIPALGVGEIFLEFAGRNQTVDVKSESGEPIPSGTLVEVVSVSGNIGFVKPAQP